MRVYDQNGSAYNLEASPLHAGGEGMIYGMAGRPGIVAKIYLPSSDSRESALRQAKVEAMAREPTKPADRNIAWPTAALYKNSGQSGFVGFAMSRIPSGKSLGDLCAYPQGKNISQRDRVRVAIAIASLTQTMHAVAVVGDFNDGNILVLPGCKAALVDCDSFDVRVGGRHFPCIAAKPGYNAPEVLKAVRGSSYLDCAAAGKTVFTRESDNWALGVHVFRLLFNGVHPFHCVPLPDDTGSYPAPVSEEKRVERCETPFFRKLPGLKKPDFAPDISGFPDYLVDAFRRAFVGKNPADRPDAAEWVSILSRYESEIRVCHADGAHYYHPSAGACPYCAAELRYSKTRQKATAGNTTTAIARKVSAAVSSVVPKPVSAKPGAAPPGAVLLGGNRIGKGATWVLSLAVALLIALVGCAIPTVREVSANMLGTSNLLLTWAVLAVGAIAAACLFTFVYDKDTLKSVGLSSACATGGAVVALPVAAALLFVLKVLAVVLVISMVCVLISALS